ncbi:hypothetical protein J1D01_14130 [Seonamhaeicola sp. NFXS20]|uniref:hypothetical protein n=2 Tax=unclassified Seonamhaeicola TaxID=2622645 RepID=UPI003B8B48DA
MKSYELSFGIINIIKNNLAEVIVNEGVVMDELIIDEYHDFLLTNLEAPFSLLINKKHSYTYTFEAQKTITHLDQINKMAVLFTTSGAFMSTKTLISVNAGIDNKIKMFKNRGEALNWLNKQ